MRKVPAVLLTLVLALGLAACGQSADLISVYAGIDSAESPTPVSNTAFPLAPFDKEVTVGIAARNMNAGFFYALHTSVQSTLESYGVTALLADANDSAQTQSDQIDNFIVQGVDGIVINVATPEDAVTSALQRAAEAGIPVVGVDSILEIGFNNFLGFVGGDNFLLGRGIGAYMAEQLLARNGVVEGNVAILNGQPNPIADLRVAGFWAGIESVAPDHGLKEVAHLYGGAWNEEAGVNMGEDVLVAHPHLDLIMGTADPFVVGAMAAARRMGRDEMIMGAVDGSKIALALVAEGTPVEVITLQDPVGLGQLSSRILLDFIVNGNTPQYRIMRLDHPVATPQNIDALYDPDAAF